MPWSNPGQWHLFFSILVSDLNMIVFYKILTNDFF